MKTKYFNLLTLFALAIAYFTIGCGGKGSYFVDDTDVRVKTIVKSKKIINNCDDIAYEVTYRKLSINNPSTNYKVSPTEKTLRFYADESKRTNEGCAASFLEKDVAHHIEDHRKSEKRIHHDNVDLIDIVATYRGKSAHGTILNIAYKRQPGNPNKNCHPAEAPGEDPYLGYADPNDIRCIGPTERSVNVAEIQVSFDFDQPRTAADTKQTLAEALIKSESRFFTEKKRDAGAVSIKEVVVPKTIPHDGPKHNLTKSLSETKTL